MAQYVNKDALVAEITRRKTNIKEYCLQKGHDERFDVVPEQLAHILSFIDTLEVKEVNLEKEIDNVWNPHFNLGWDDNSLLSINHKSFESIAKHFFELGIQARKKE